MWSHIYHIYQEILEVDGGSEQGDEDSGTDTTTFDEVVEKNGEVGIEESNEEKMRHDDEDSSTPFQNRHPFRCWSLNDQIFSLPKDFSESIEDISNEPQPFTTMPSEFQSVNS